MHLFFHNVLKTRSVNESEKLPIHVLEIEPMVEPRLNQYVKGHQLIIGPFKTLVFEMGVLYVEKV